MESGGARGGRGRASLVLAVLGALLLLVGSLFFYAGQAIFDSDGFAKRAASALEDERVRGPLAEKIVDSLIENAEPDLVNARPLLVSVTSGILDTGSFKGVFRGAAKRAHSLLFTREGNNFVLNLADGTALAVGALKSISPKLANEVPKGATARLNDLVESNFAIAFVQAGESVRFLGIGLPIVALLMLALAVGIDRDRRRGFLNASISVAVAAGLGLAGLLVLRVIVLGAIDTDLRDAAAGIWGAYLGDLRTYFLVGLGAALIAAAAVSTRERVDARAHLRRLGELAGQTPPTAWGKALRALVILVLGIFIVASPEGFLRLVTVAIGAYAIFLALTELLILIVPPPPPSEEDRRPLHRRIRPIPVIASIALIVAALLAVVLIGDEKGPGPRKRVASSIERCNGFAELCDRRLNEVVFPSVHNAMSAANDGFLIANNQKPIPDQLDAGVRGLLIDAHYGRESDGGKVVTDLKKEGQTRQEIVDAVGEEFVQTAERLVGRISGTDAKGKSASFFCHVFCELGAIPLAEELTRIREFLDAHPDEVVVLFIEDYVTPDDIAKGFTESGLIDYAYELEPGQPLPTLRDVIASGKRAIVMAEKTGGGEKYPWYAQGFDITQETPYTFHNVKELEAKASCDDNRGNAGNPLFQLNHWVEAIPRSPKTAAKVNADKFLRKRALRCARERGLLPNLVAVDFWEQGDLFGVAQRLNGLDAGAKPEFSQND